MEKSEAGDRGRLLVDLTLVPTLSEYKENIKSFDASKMVYLSEINSISYQEDEINSISYREDEEPISDKQSL